MSKLTKDLAEILSKAGVDAAYGTPVDVREDTIVPVAVTTYGFGGGEANEHTASTTPSGGGGGGGMSVPVGAYVNHNGVARFQPNTIALLAVGVPFMFVSGRALARVIRALKR